MKPKAVIADSAPTAEDRAMMAMILQKAKAGSVGHAALLADAADYGRDGVHANVTQDDLEAVLGAMAQKAEAQKNKRATRLLPKLRKALAVVTSRTPPVSRG
jgi:hypothetical protein